MLALLLMYPEGVAPAAAAAGWLRRPDRMIRTRCLGEGNDRGGVDETRPEADDEGGVAALRLAGRQEPLHRERDRGGRGVAGGGDVSRDLDVFRQLAFLLH